MMNKAKGQKPVSKPVSEPVDYEVMQAREIQDVWRAVGETVTLQPKAAKYYLPPYGSGLRLKGAGASAVEPQEDPKAKPAKVVS
jgi:hypothetical protein